MMHCIRFSSASLCLFIVTTLLGCPGKSDVPLIDGNANTSTKVDTSSDNGNRTQLTAEQRKRLSQCEDNLVAIIGGMSFNRLGIDTDPDAQLSDLNNWLATCGPDGEEPLANDKDVRAAFLTPDVAELTESSAFQPSDLGHIRDSSLSRAIGKHAATDPSSDLTVINDLFDRVIRNVALVAANYGELPLDPASLWLQGIGGARDRAWLFAQLLRQYRIDAVVIEFPSGFNADPYILVAAVTRGENAAAYLFDPITGLPIPSPSDENALAKLPAKWTDASKNDKVFRQLDRGNDIFPLRSDRCESAQLFVVGDLSLFSPRMALLQDALPSEKSTQLYEGLGENKLASPGLLDRLSSALNVESSRLRPWPHSFAGRLANTKLTQATQQLIKTRNDVLLAPYSLQPAVNDETQEPILKSDGTPMMIPVAASMQNESNLLTGRLAQLSGDSRKALMAYLAVRGPKFGIEINQIAAADAEYWVGVTQYESGRVDLATKSLEKFITKPFQSIWGASARRLLTTIYAEQGDFKAALKAAQGKDVDPGTLAMVSRWKSQGRLDGLLETPNETAPEPATEKTESDGKKPAEPKMKEEAAKEQPDGAQSTEEENKTASPEVKDTPEPKSETPKEPASDSPKSDEPAGEPNKSEETSPEPASAGAAE